MALKIFKIISFYGFVKTRAKFSLIRFRITKFANLRNNVNFIIDNWSLLLIAAISGGMLFFPSLKGMSGASITAAAAVQLMNREKAQVIDVRAENEFSVSHVVGAKNVPLEKLEEKLATVVRNKALPVVLICATSARANRALPLVKKLGFEAAYVLEGGMKAWKDANLPLESKA